MPSPVVVSSTYGSVVNLAHYFNSVPTNYVAYSKHNFQEPVAKKPEPVPEVEKNVVDDENGWETAPGKNKKGKMNKGGKANKKPEKPVEPVPVQEKKPVAPKAEPKKEQKKEKSDNSEPVKVEPVEVVKPAEEPRKESPPPPKASILS